MEAHEYHLLYQHLMNMELDHQQINHDHDFSAEKHRRQQLNDRFCALKTLIPNPTKADRASVIGDAIEYVKELKSTVEELKTLVDKKRCNRSRMKSKNTDIDVRITDDEVTIKLVQKKRIDCLLLVSKVLDELQLDVHHVAGKVVGDFYSYLINTKIGDGSSVDAKAIANKLIEVVDKQDASIPLTSRLYLWN